jgi:hypothetical protein
MADIERGNWSNYRKSSALTFRQSNGLDLMNQLPSNLKSQTCTPQHIWHKHNEITCSLDKLITSKKMITPAHRI